MSRLIKALRNRKQDTVYEEVLSSKPEKRKREIKKKVRSESTLPKNVFTTLLESFLDRKETISRYNKENEEIKPKLVEYAREHGTEDEKGNRLLQVGDMVAKVQLSKSYILNSEAVERLIHRLTKKGILSKKEAKKVMYREHHIVLSELQYSRLKKHLQNEAVLTTEQVHIDEAQLDLLVAQGQISIREREACYTVDERTSFVPTRLKGDS